MRTLSVLMVIALLLSACAPTATPTSVPTAVSADQTPVPTPLPPTATAVPVPTATTAPLSTTVPARTLYPAPTNLIPATLVATEISPLGFVHTYSVDAWFDNPNPPMGSNVTLSASLLHNGVWGGNRITFYWVQDGEAQTLSEIVIYQRGILTLPVTGFEPGVYVPITYTFMFDDGRTFTGYTGFTPK